MVGKIIEHMNEIPYKDKKGSVYKYGEFYPLELCPFGYNETSGMDQFPLTKEEALKRGYNWQDNLQRTVGKETLKPEDISDSISDVDESILTEILACISCSRNYKIVENELIFYKKMGVPIPHKCFFCRHETRVKRRNPFKLWKRNCMCQKSNHGHTGNCKNEFETSYAPDPRYAEGSGEARKPEIVYCEKCYQKEVY